MKKNKQTKLKYFHLIHAKKTSTNQRVVRINIIDTSPENLTLNFRPEYNYPDEDISQTVKIVSKRKSKDKYYITLEIIRKSSGYEIKWKEKFIVVESDKELREEDILVDY